MIKDALNYIVGLGEAKIHNFECGRYSDKPLHRIPVHVPTASKITMHTLTSLVDYIKGEIDDMPEKMIVEVESPTKVNLYSKLIGERVREHLVTVEARVPEFSFEYFMEQERFCIGLQSKFIESNDRALVLKFAGTVEAGTVAEYGDDGISQKATVKTGLASKGEAIVPSPALLKPYRTFLEVEQPTSEFIFRMKQDRHDGVLCALFEADGGAWKMEATKAIKEYLQKELAEYPQFTIIS